ncbi:MAG: hypothetical protein GY729_00180 [Desulfobacteraceae bacterium]|nr:hypothetical protein [Desulfobacteraceae bacterium]
MTPKSMMKQMIDFQKFTFDNTFEAMGMVQQQTEKVVSNFVDQASWLPEEGKKAIEDWVKTYKHGRETFKKSVDESFTKVESYFNQEG